MAEQKQEKTLILKGENRSFTNKDGKKVNFTALYVVVMGIEIKLRAIDDTAKKLLENYFKD